jgi:hypothetical protein
MQKALVLTARRSAVAMKRRDMERRVLNPVIDWAGELLSDAASFAANESQQPAGPFPAY